MLLASESAAFALLDFFFAEPPKATCGNSPVCEIDDVIPCKDMMVPYDWR